MKKEMKKKILSLLFIANQVQPKIALKKTRVVDLDPH
jgi:hypothetical protein